MGSTSREVNVTSWAVTLENARRKRGDGVPGGQKGGGGGTSKTAAEGPRWGIPRRVTSTGQGAGRGKKIVASGEEKRPEVQEKTTKKEAQVPCSRPGEEIQGEAVDALGVLSHEKGGPERREVSPKKKRKERSESGIKLTDQ